MEYLAWRRDVLRLYTLIFQEIHVFRYSRQWIAWYEDAWQTYRPLNRQGKPSDKF